jgi:cell division protein FtsA
MRGEVLSSKIVIGTMPKEELYRFLEVLKLAGVETLDVGFTSTGDYYTIKNSKYDGIVGAIINIGEDNTNVAVYNKGIQIKNAVLPIGSSNVDKDLAYIFKMKDNAARNLKETFAVSMSNYADSTDIVEVKNNNGEIKEISQVGVSKVVESRIREILKLAKNEIKNLTNREISYIIVTGGLSELAGFGYLVEEMFGAMAKVCNITTMGIRHNKYVSVLGIVKYLDDKLSLRGKQMNMIDGEEFDDLVSPQHKMINNENMIGKVLGHFFDS